MSNNEINSIVTSIFKSKPIFEDIASDQDFFDLGASSLTVVEMQLQIEKELDVQVDTSKLMGKPTLQGWVDIYVEQTSA